MESTSEVVSNTVAEKSVCVEGLPEKTGANKQHVEEEVKVTIKKGVEDGNKKIVETVEEKGNVEQIVHGSTTQKETEEVEEDDDEEAEAKVVEEDTNQKVRDVVVDTSDGGQSTIVNVKTVNKVTPCSTETVTTNSSEIGEKPEVMEASKDKKEENKEDEVKEEEYEEETEEEEVKKVKQEVTNEKVSNELEKAAKPCQQHLNKNQILEEPEYKQQPVSVKEETVVDAPSAVLQTNQQYNNISNKQESLNNTIKDIISSIDSNIKAEENIAALKERDLELLKKQHELSKEIEQQKLLAQKLVNENKLQDQKINNKLVNQESSTPPKMYQPTTNISKYSTYDEKLDNNIYSQKFETSETRESTNVSKKIDLNKIFTPATDYEETLPKNRKLYASSAFYSPTLHPTVEDQVALARRISHSLSDISNQQSRGQSMYVNRKKRSVKWVHEGCGQDYHQYQQQPKPSTSPSILPAYTDAAKHRVQLNLHQEQLLEKYAKPSLKVVQTPWEAALNSGSASAAFVEDKKLSPYRGATVTPSPAPQIYDASQGEMLLHSAPTVHDSFSKTYSSDDFQRCPTQAAPQQQAQHERQYTGTNSQRELAYKPSIPQGWKAPSMSLPKDLYMPKEIPLQSYAPPPVAVSHFPSNIAYDANQFNPYKSSNASAASPMPSNSLNESTPVTTKSFGGSSTFPVSKPYQQGFSLTYGIDQPPKQQYLPAESYQKVPQTTSQNIPQVSFNPSPLPYDKLAKFENQPAIDGRFVNSPLSRVSYANVRGRKVRNASPAPFAGLYNRPYTPSSDSHYYGGTPSASPRPLSSTHLYSGYNTTNRSPPSVTSNKILNAPSYNSSARGWGCNVGATTGYQYSQSHMSATKPQIVNAASMPYTDF